MKTFLITIALPIVLGLLQLWFVFSFSAIAELKSQHTLAKVNSIIGRCNVAAYFILRVLSGLIDLGFSHINDEFLSIIFVISTILSLIYGILIFCCVLSYDKNFSFSEKSLKVDCLLCIFLGFFGLHKFYEGKIKLGIAYIVLSIASIALYFVNSAIGTVLGIILSIILTIDISKIASNNVTDCNGAYILRWNSIKRFSEDLNNESIEIEEKVLKKLLEKASFDQSLTKSIEKRLEKFNEKKESSEIEPK